MRKNLVFIVLSLMMLTSVTVQATSSSHTTNTITVFCPSADAVHAAGSGSWGHSTKFTADTSYEYRGVNNKLTLSGDAETSSAAFADVATWTDRTFLCHYNEGMDVIVLANSDLDSQVSRCYFPGNKSECSIASGDPHDCPMTCEMQS